MKNDFKVANFASQNPKSGKLPHPLTFKHGRVLTCKARHSKLKGKIVHVPLFIVKISDEHTTRYNKIMKISHTMFIMKVFTLIVMCTITDFIFLFVNGMLICKNHQNKASHGKFYPHNSKYLDVILNLLHIMHMLPSTF